MSNRFNALGRTSDDESDDSEERVKSAGTTINDVPSYEDLSLTRMDEETVLKAVYGEDFTREDGAWGCPCLSVHVRPPDTPSEHVGSEVTLSVQLGKTYPYVSPGMDLRNVRGLSPDEQRNLLDLLKVRSHECARSGSVMMCELVQTAEDFLLLHNKDPVRQNMSAWEQMKEREAAEELKQREEEDKVRIEEIEIEGHSGPYKREYFPSTDGASGWQHVTNNDATIEMEKELARQRDALNTAAERRKMRNKNFAAESRGGAKSDNQSEANDSTDDGVEIDDDEFEDTGPLAVATSSRYKADFIERGLLGRGGGGEVVKVRNRLDLRIYAVKKIPLEPEHGKYALTGAIQNRKLRREVTTISRMTHKNIVRYYQAWVEGGEGVVDDPDSKTSLDEVGSRVNDDTDDFDRDKFSDSASDSDSGWWEKSPAGPRSKAAPNGPVLELGDSAADNAAVSDGGASNETSHCFDLGQDLDYHSLQHSAKTSDLMGQHHSIGTQNPLFMGFGNSMYDNLAAQMKRVSASASEQSDESLIDDDSSQKVKEGEGQRILYIQMEYCATTLRHLIDESAVSKMEANEIWKLARQLVEALVYIHKRSIIHRDLKPGNVFLDSEGNIRLGDFGLATKHRGGAEDDESTFGLNDDVVRDTSASHNHGWSAQGSSRLSRTSSSESLTGGVGTTFYRAPEQEAAGLSSCSAQRETPYGTKADIFSLGIVLFEMFSAPFETQMERAEILTTLRGDNATHVSMAHVEKDSRSNKPGFAFPARSSVPCQSEQTKIIASGRWKDEALRRFPISFSSCAPENAQKVILWCLERSPSQRPSAEELLASELIPQEQRYLQEALKCLSNPSSESSRQITQFIFERPTPQHVEAIFDTDVALKYQSIEEKRNVSPLDALRKSLGDLGGFTDLGVESFISSNISLAAAASTLRRARNAGKAGRGGREGELLRGAPRQAAVVLAAGSAASAAITGQSGANPRFVEFLAKELVKIFEAHGAAHLRCPLLRPRLSQLPPEAESIGGPAEVMDRRGTVLLLPEDLTANFARAVGRGGSAASNIKRWDIDKVYHRSPADGHPRESLEATFDIVFDDPYAKPVFVEAETIMVLCQVLATKSLCLGQKNDGMSLEAQPGLSPVWFLRLTHTRLADAILELCGVPQKESARRACFHVFTCCCACPPGFFSRKPGCDSGVMEKRVDGGNNLSRYLDVAIARHGLPKSAAERLKCFLSTNCLPLPGNVDDALKELREGVRRLRALDAGTKVAAKRAKRYEDAGRSLSSLSQFVEAVKSLGIQPVLGGETSNNAEHQINQPYYISLDLGLRQRRKHIHGHLLYQGVMLPDNYFSQAKSVVENLDTVVGNGGSGVRIAEGGRYDDLVRRCRPPGNFGSTSFNHYTAASFPLCCCVRLFVSKLVERAFSLASLESASNNLNVSAIEALRRSLGQPMLSLHPITCIVASANGMDAGTLGERAIVASRLWSAGIAAEYLPQSAVFASLFRRSPIDLSSSSSELTLDDLCAMCIIFKIPFVAIVAPHLLKDKGAVRLRPISFESAAQSFSSEEFVSLDSLSSTIRDRLALVPLDKTSGVMQDPGELALDRQIPLEENSSRNNKYPSAATKLQCIYVESDQFYGHEKMFKGDSVSKKVLKTVAKVTNRTEAYLEGLLDYSSFGGQGAPAVATDLPFWVLRDFGTGVMKDGGLSAQKAGNEVAQKYPKHKKVLKTLSMALDYVIREHGMITNSRRRSRSISDESCQPKTTLSLLLYSIPDDQFDMITLGGGLSRPTDATTNNRRK